MLFFLFSFPKPDPNGTPLGFNTGPTVDKIKYPNLPRIFAPVTANHSPVFTKGKVNVVKCRKEPRYLALLSSLPAPRGFLFIPNGFRS